MSKFSKAYDQYFPNFARTLLYMNLLFLALAIPAKTFMWAVDNYVKHWPAWEQGMLVFLLATFCGAPIARYAIWLYGFLKVNKGKW